MSTATLTTPAAQAEGITTPIQWRDPIVTTAMTALTFIMALLSSGSSRVSFAGATSWFDMGNYTIPAIHKYRH